MRALLRFLLLGSGSSGNAALLYSGDTKILVDAGFSYRQLAARAALRGASLDGLDAVFVTHEHGDHVRGLGVLSRKTGVPLYMTHGTRAALPAALGALGPVHCFEAGASVRVGGMTIQSYSTSHDAADPVSYVVQCGGVRVGFANDLGHGSQLVRARLAGCHALVLESNYCPVLLGRSPYPPSVRQRIQSRLGHLSNEDMSALLRGLMHQALRTVVLFHISENSNTPGRVRQLAMEALNGHPAQLHLAQQDEPTPLFEVRP